MDLNEIMKQAQAMQSKMTEAQEAIHQKEVIGTAGGGMVRVTLTGRGVMRRVDIDPDLFSGDDREMLEDLIVAAHNDAHQRVEAMVQEETGKAMGGLQMPAGFNPFG